MQILLGRTKLLVSIEIRSQYQTQGTTFLDTNNENVSYVMLFMPQIGWKFVIHLNSHSLTNFSTSKFINWLSNKIKYDCNVRWQMIWYISKYNIRCRCSSNYIINLACFKFERINIKEQNLHAITFIMQLVDKPLKME